LYNSLKDKKFKKLKITPAYFGSYVYLYLFSYAYVQFTPQNINMKMDN